MGKVLILLQVWLLCSPFHACPWIFLSVASVRWQVAFVVSVEGLKWQLSASLTTCASLVRIDVVISAVTSFGEFLVRTPSHNGWVHN